VPCTHSSSRKKTHHRRFQFDSDDELLESQCKATDINVLIRLLTEQLKRMIHELTLFCLYWWRLTGKFSLFLA